MSVYLPYVYGMFVYMCVYMCIRVCVNVHPYCVCVVHVWVCILMCMYACGVYVNFVASETCRLYISLNLYDTFDKESNNHTCW